MAKAPLLHSVQLDDRMRRGDAEVRPRDKVLKGVLDGVIGLSLLALVVVVVGRVGLGFTLSGPQQIYILASMAMLLLGSGFVFNAIRWRALRGHHGVKILEKWKADLQLTIVSIIALVTVVFVLVVEVLALLVFLGVLQAGEAGIRFASEFILFVAIILLVQLMVVVVREYNLSSYQPHPRAVLTATILSPIAGVGILLGVALATEWPQSVGILSQIQVHQAIYIVTLGVGLEFIAMRIRLRLPSVTSLFQQSVELSRRANEDMRQVLQKRAQITYILAMVFVAVGMAMAGAIATGNIAISSGRLGLSLTIFYSGFSLILMGLIVVRILQSRHLNRPKIEDLDDLSRLVGQKRKSGQEIMRMAIYAVGGLLAVIFLAAAVVVNSGDYETRTDVPALDKNGDQIFSPDGEALTRVEKSGLQAKYSTDFALLALFSAIGPYGYFFNQERKRIEAIDEKFPDFLRDIAESARAGMTLPRALVSASHGTYGALTKEIKQMAAQVEWGIEFGEALERFAQRAKTPLIDRTVALVVEAQRAGGNVVDVLTAASDDAREIKQIVSERNEQMKMYSVVVYIAFFVFIAVVMILSSQFIPAFRDATEAAGGQADVGGISLRTFDPDTFNNLFLHAAIIQAIGGGLVGGVMTRGHPVAGFNSMFIMIGIAWFAFRIIIGLQ